MKSGFVIAAAAAVLFSGAAGAARAAEIKVLSTQATEQSYRELVPRFERSTGHKVTTVFTGTLDADKRLAAGETYDLLIMSRPSIEEHIKDGKLASGSRVDIAKSGVGIGVKSGARKPDIGSTEALKKTLLAAKSIGYSTGPSGNYIVALFQRLGIAEEIKPKLKQTPTSIFVGSIVASGEVELGFQQISEISHFPGVDYAGPLPSAVQEYTTFSSGIVSGTRQAAAAKAFVKFLTSPGAAPAFKNRGMEPG